MKPGARIQAAIEIMEHVQSIWQADKRAPVDGLLADYFRARRYIGSKDRGAISELVYFTLRFGGSLQWHIEACDRSVTPRRVVMVALLFQPDALDVSSIAEAFDGAQYCPAVLTDQERKMLERCAKHSFRPAEMPEDARLNYPQWAEGRLKDAFGDALPEAMEALNQQAPIDLRANTLKCKDASDLILALDKDGYFGLPTPLSPVGVRLKKRLPAFNTQAFKDGKFEMQDEGSQIAALLVKAKPGQKVIDFCAGAGGKTLAIAATMQNKGRILAWDTSAGRLAQMGKRLARAGVSNVQTHVLRDEADPFLKRHLASADWVLVDAPCSGSGTWRRNPDLKWRFTLDDLQEVKSLQQKILQNAARLVKPGGRLVYVTCSVFPDENFWQVKQFLGGNPNFRVEAPDKLWNNQLLARDGVGASLVLSPHKDGTDGFFAAVLLKDAVVPKGA
ncbi:MAG: RsmB/NOP family class I SAM-dependent RNA methyltransferase [Rickettsiales bacterium]